MTSIQRSSLLALLCIPFFALAAGKADVPTSIQVVDEFGHTEKPTQDRAVPPLEKYIAFTMPKECAALALKNKSPEKTIIVPEGHPLSTRIESQRSSLDALVRDLHITSFLSSSENSALKDYLSSPEILLGTSTMAFDCLLSLDKVGRAENDPGESARISHISQIIGGIRYGIKSTHEIEVLSPTTETETLYAGDLLQIKYPSVTSLSIKESHADIVFTLPVLLFGGWRTNATTHVTLGTDATVDAPWWIILGRSRLSVITKELQKIPHTTGSLPGMFEYTKDALAAVLS